MASDSILVRCSACGAKNKIPLAKSGKPAKCGKCGADLKTSVRSTGPADTYKIRCLHCKAKNKVPAEKISAGAKCGKCGAALPTEDLFSKSAVMITDDNFEARVIQSPLPVLLFAWAPWCPTCHTFMPVIDKYATIASGRVRVGKLNVDGNPKLASTYNILSVPFLFIFDNGRLRESMPGAMQEHEIMIKMARYI